MRNEPNKSHTPRLNLQRDKGLSNTLRLRLLLLPVRRKVGLTLLNDLGVLIFTAEEVHVIIFVSGLILGVSGDLGRLGAVSSESLRRVTRESRELRLVRGNVLVPASNVGVLLGVRSAREGLEGHDIGLGRRVASGELATMLSTTMAYRISTAEQNMVASGSLGIRNAISRNGCVIV